MNLFSSHLFFLSQRQIVLNTKGLFLSTASSSLSDSGWEGEEINDSLLGALISLDGLEGGLDVHVLQN